MKLNKSLKAVFVAAALMPLASQATVMTKSSTDNLTKIVYVCENKETLEVIFVNTEKDSYAIINQANEMIPMQLQKTASGALYKAIDSDYTSELITKAKTAVLSANGKPILSKCVTE